MNAQTQTSDILNQLKSLSIDPVHRAEPQAHGSEQRTGLMPWKAVLMTGTLAVLGAAAWYSDFQPMTALNGLTSQSSAAVETPVVATTAPLSVETATLAPTPIVPVLAPQVVGSGYVVADLEANVMSDISGRLVAVHAQIGDTVEQGQVIAVLNSDAAQADLSIAQANFAMAQVRESVAVAALAQARAEAATKEALAARGSVATLTADTARLAATSLEGDLAVAQQSTVIAELELAKQQAFVDRHVVTAPFSGVVVERHLNVGDIAAQGQPGLPDGIITVLDPNALSIEVDVAENNLSSLTPGQTASVTLDAWPNHAFAAEVLTISPKVSIQRGTVKVRLSFETPPLGVFANMAAKVTFNATQTTAANL